MSEETHIVSGRERALAAAVRVILRDGILAMTLDAVAKEAGLSKGGLLYHFASKELLIRGLIEQFISLFEQRMQELRETDVEPVGRWIRAYVRASYEKLDGMAPGVSPQELRQVFFSLLATLVLSPTIAGVVREVTERWRKEIEGDGLEPTEQMLLLAAADGLLFWEMIQVMLPEDPLRPKLVEALLGRVAQLPRRPFTSAANPV